MAKRARTTAAGTTVGRDGDIYVTGSTVRAGRTSLLLQRYSPAGALFWTRTFNSTAESADAGLGVAAGPYGNIHVTGFTAVPGQNFDLLLLTCAPDGSWLETKTWNGTPNGSDIGKSIAAAGNDVYVLGATYVNGRHTDILLLKYQTNAPPIAVAQGVTITAGKASGIVLRATDSDGDPLTYTVVTSPARGTLGGKAPDLTYQPTAGFIGSDSFTFKANDGIVDSNTATVNITVVADNARLTGSILINNGAASTSTTIVTLNLSASDSGGSGLASMHFRNSPQDPYSIWEPFTTTKNWTLTSGLGTKKVYAQFVDNAGNLSDANSSAAGAQGYMDAIEKKLVDNAAPIGSIKINNGAALTSIKAV